MSLRIQPASKLVLIGDSITDCERARPVGEGLFAALGKGYVSLVDSLLQATYPQQQIRVVNMGISGNIVRDLKGRWSSDVLALEPDWLSIMIGINDVWRHFDSPWQREWHVPLAEYRLTLDTLVATTLPQLKGLVLMTPYVIEPNRADPMRQMMDEYGAVVQEIAASYGVLLVDTQAAFDRVLAHLHPMALAWDRIHPTLSGHTILARAFLDTIGFEWATAR
ncbi:MAG TPA: SGNH/GDSL hydrolase family protein [Caldilineaceae bacterium]|nr:SGNH/GDSL hydrolase family protein [Caldilineaceae bacterium]